MNNVSIISYPSHKDDSLLSLSDVRSKYMIPFAGRYRVADFTLRNAYACQAKKTLIFSKVHDDLSDYIAKHPLYRNNAAASTRIYNNPKFSVSQCSKLLFTKPTSWFIIYNGDCPSILDFSSILDKAKSKKNSGPVLYMIDYDGKPTMSRIVLLCDKKSLESIMNRLIKDKMHSPNIFEMVINSFILKGVKRDTLKGYFRPLLSVPEYYHSNFEAVKDPDIYHSIAADNNLKAGIQVEDFSFLSSSSNVSASHLSDGCKIYGSVQNSILFPGCVIEDNAVIKDSIVLPFGRIGENTRLDRVIIDEFTDHMRTDSPRNINVNSFIGSGISGYKNADFPKSLYDSISLIGKNCSLPEGLRIGSACFLASGTGNAPFEKTKILEDSLSIADTFNIHANDPD